MKASFRRLWGSGLLLAAMALLAEHVCAREWTDVTGSFRVEAELVDHKDGIVRLRKPDGSIISVPLAKLSKGDQNFVLKPNSSAAQARDVLNKFCHSCHGDGGSDEGGMNYVLNVKRLIDNEKIAPGDPANSELLKRIVDGEMPPDGETPRPSKAEIELLTTWIAAGAPALAEEAERTFVSNDQIIQSILTDIDAAPERNRQFYRYFTITHLFNALIPDDELDTYRLALSKLLNSLSWERDLVAPKAIDPDATIFRVDIRDMRWSKQYWDSIVSLYPYGVRQVSSEANRCYKDTGTPIPYVRADWFVATASRPPLYHGLLALPDSLEGLASMLHIDFKRNVAQDRAARAGFVDSGISENPRIIERHRISDGACWLSHDFASSTDRKNFFSHPLEFEPDGGEIIFNLPNGLQAYLLVDAEGRRIDTAPTRIVKDPETADGAVMNGVSCMRCHAGGIIPKFDEVRRSVVANSRAFGDQLDNITAVYVEREELERLIDEDRERFLSAMRRLGLTRFSTAGEPIYNIARRFEEPLDIHLASAELGLQADQLKQELGQRVTLQRTIGQLSVNGGTVPRDAFQQAFGGVLETVRTGRFHPPTQALAESTKSGAGASPSPAGGPTSGLAHHWRFDETKGDLARDVEGRNNASLANWSGDEPRWVPGKIGNALHFSRPEHQLLTAKDIDFPQLTIAFWIQVQLEGGINPAIVRPWLSLGSEHGRGVGVLGSVAEPTKPPPGEWVHYTVTIDQVRKEAAIYRDGEEVASGKLDRSRDKGVRWIIGHNFDPANHRDHFNGLLDDLRVYRRILAPEEAKRLAGVEEAGGLLDAASTGRVDPPGQELGDSGLASLTSLSRWPAFLMKPGQAISIDKDGARLPDATFVRTKAGNYLEKDFVFEVVYRSSESDGLLYFGFGEGLPEPGRGEPTASIKLAVQPPRPEKGDVRLTRGGDGGGQVIGQIRKAGVHRVILEKQGGSLRLAIDVDNDGPSSDDVERTISDFKAFAPFLHETNTHLFFGGAAIFQQAGIKQIAGVRE